MDKNYFYILKKCNSRILYVMFMKDLKTKTAKFANIYLRSILIFRHFGFKMLIYYDESRYIKTDLYPFIKIETFFVVVIILSIFFKQYIFFMSQRSEFRKQFWQSHPKKHHQNSKNRHLTTNRSLYQKPNHDDPILIQVITMDFNYF